MRAMVLVHPKQPLEPAAAAGAPPGPEQVLIRVHACGVCRTDLHIVDGELPAPKLPLVPGMRSSGAWSRAGAGRRRLWPG